MIATNFWLLASTRDSSSVYRRRQRYGFGSLVLVASLAAACSRAPQSNTPSTEEVVQVQATEGGTGTRSKGEQEAPPAVSSSASNGVVMAPEKDRPRTESKLSAQPAPALPQASEPSQGQLLALGNAAGGMDLSGRAQGAAGLAQSYGTGQGRLGGGVGAAIAHARASAMKSAAALQLVAPSSGGAAPDFNTENYDHITENRFFKVSDQPLSTFSIDVDTASYSNARRFLTQGNLPPKDAIRVEEWVNYFAYDYAPPDDDKPFSVNAEVASCPWNAAHRLVRIGLKGKVIADANVPPRNLVFLIDVSGSMMEENKLPLVKHGLSLLAQRLRPEDTIAIVVYAGASGLALPPTHGSERGRILAALDQLEAGGSTNGGDGIRLAYATAQQTFQKSGINRVILATDGDFNVGTTSEGELQRLIEEKRNGGVFLTVLGFGMGNIKDSTLEMLADKGNGNYAYVDSAHEAQKVLVREAGSTLVTIAKDVKLQVEFNPKNVSSYKLIGYENRLLAKEDFNDDKKDAGEIGAGHSVTALYEVVPTGAPLPAVPAVDPLKYQAPGTLSGAAQTAELLTVNVRYKPIHSETSTKFSVVVNDGVRPIEQMSNDYRFSVAVANVALLLRGSPDVKNSSLQTARALAAGALGADAYGDRREFLALVDRATALGVEHPSLPLAVQK